MDEFLRGLERRLMDAPDGVCLDRVRLVTEAWKQYESEPLPLRRALAMRDVMANMTLDLETNPVFAGNTSSRPHAVMPIAECGFEIDAQTAFEYRPLAHILDNAIPAEYRDYWESRTVRLFGPGAMGHFSPDYSAVVCRGLGDTLEQLDRFADRGSKEEKIYRRAMRIAVDAVIAWAHRYADAAEAAAAKATDPAVAACHRRVLRACRHVPEHPARDYFEGLQAIALIHLALAIEGHYVSVSIGLPDRALAGFGSEVECKYEESVDLARAFLLKIASNSVSGRGAKTQSITVGGADACGKDCANAVTLALIDAFDRTPVYDPVLFVRWHPGLAREVFDRAATVISRGRSMPLLINDECTARGFVGAGFRPEDAWEYCVIGCNELGVPGRAFDSAVNIGNWFNDLDLVTLAVRETPAERMLGVDAVLEGVSRVAERMLRETIRRRDAIKGEAAEKLPMPFTTALMRGCVESGRDYMVSMPYQQACVYTRGFTNAVNALAALEQVVFAGRTCSAAAFQAAMAAEFPDEGLRRQIRAAPKWGHDDSRVDGIALKLVAAIRRGYRKAEAEFGAAPYMVCHVVRSLHHLDGLRMPASPDGRRKGEPLADSIGAADGVSPRGPTAILNSVAKLDAARDFAGGYNLNLTLAAGSGASPEAIRSLTEGFFRQGGQELQINVLDAAVLREARCRPERFRHIVVRVAGLNSRFVDLSPVEQDEIIRRADGAARFAAG